MTNRGILRDCRGSPQKSTGKIIYPVDVQTLSLATLLNIQSSHWGKTPRLCMNPATRSSPNEA